MNDDLQKTINRIFLKLEDGVIEADDARLQVFSAIEDLIE